MRPLPKTAERALKGQEGLENLTGLYCSKNVWIGFGGAQKGLKKVLGGYQ